MYTNILNVQILISLLKKYKLSRIVLSPGGSDIPIIHSVENDEFFQCYSIVDERSAVYFALGMAQETNSPVVCVCTSGTAVCNYLPGITEAFYQNVPIIAITADKNPYRINQLETQKIDQSNIFKGVIKKSVDLPIIHNEEEKWYCIRLINEALIEMNHHGQGPVHINIPVMGNYFEYDKNTLPNVKKIDFLTESEQTVGKWYNCVKTLENCNRILFLFGQNVCLSENDTERLNIFFKRFNCVIITESISNIYCEGAINGYPIVEACSHDVVDSLAPDLIISVGNNVAAYQFKPFIRRNSSHCIHWEIDECGRIRDMFNCLNLVFESSISSFLKYFIKESSCELSNNLIYYNEWKAISERIRVNTNVFSSLHVAEKLSDVIEDGSIIHTAILNSTRIFQLFQRNTRIKHYSNIGALGIDGCLSTFLGHAVVCKNKAYCLIGDLSFFYDMNSLGIKHLTDNVKIILLNNFGACEFHIMSKKTPLCNIDDNISVKHEKNAEGWVKSLNINYYSASDKLEFDVVFPKFMNDKRASLIEIFTNMETDTEVEDKVFKEIKYSTGGKREQLKETAKAIFTPKQIASIKKIIKH